MYTDFYKLARPAFEPRYQPSFWWQGGVVQSCYDSLFAGVDSGGAFQLVTGGPGSGKSTLLYKLCTDFTDTIRVALLAGADIRDFYNDVISGFGFAKEVDGKVEFVIELSRILKEGVTEGLTFLLVIDDAEKLEQTVFEELRMLLGLEKDGQPLLRLLLAGKQEVMARLALPENEILRQKLTNHLELAPLSEQECSDYIEHRLRVAGAEEQIFTSEAASIINKSADGRFKIIDLLCTRVLEEGAEQQEQQLSASFVEPVVQLDWEEFLAGDLRQISKEKKKARPTRQSPAETATSVAAAVQAAVSDTQQEAEKGESAASPKKEKKLLLRAIVVAIICVCLFFLYQYISSLQRTVPTDDSQPQQISLSQRQQKLPLVTAGTGNLTSPPPVFTNTPVPSAQKETVTAAEKKQNGAEKDKEGDGRINVHSLDVIE